MRKSALPSQFDQPETSNPKAEEEPMSKPFIKIAELNRAITPDAIDLIQGTLGDVRIQLSDGSTLQVRKFDPEELVRLLSPHMTSPFLPLRTSSASGRTIYLNSGALSGFSTTGVRVLVYFGMNRPLQLEAGYSATDLQAALEAAGRRFVTIEPAPPVPIIESRQASSLPAYDIDRYNLGFPGRV